MTIAPAVATKLPCPRCGAGAAPGQRFCSDCGLALAGSEPLAPRGVPERRHMTVMFCDLVGSTALSERLDPEELGDVILAYREVIAAAVQRYEGHVARYVGDGVLAYFGYPQAHEDDPARSLHAALDVLAGMRLLAQGLKLKDVTPQVRIGIHTGLVVVGELARGAVREEDGVLGETPNLAARLMALAAPDSIHVSEVTHALARGQFAWREVGATHLAGLSRSVKVYEPLRASRPDGAREPSVASTAPRLAGRTAELAYLQQRWRSALAGDGQAVLLLGEPGIGKSRLLSTFAADLAADDPFTVVFYCSPYFSNSALFAVVDYLNRWLDWTDEDKLEKLAKAVTAIGMSPMEVVPVIATLLQIPIRPPYQAAQVSAPIQREMTMEFLREWVTRQAADSPALLIVEDLHWCDASTLELIESLLERIETSRILLVLSSRSEPQAPLRSHPRLSKLQLDRLSTAQVLDMIGQVTGGRALPDAVSEQVVRKTDGVPLFVEELTKAVLESGVLVMGEHGYELPDLPVQLEIPISLHATLIARLDTLGSAKAIAQRAAILGREFSQELLQAVLGMPPEELDQGLARLVEAGLLVRRDDPLRAIYAFKHSMIQETAYRTLLRTQRRQHHLHAAEVIATRFPQIRDTQPELVAHHFSEGHQPVNAAHYRRRAAELALSQSANVEAYAHVEKALAELAPCPPSPMRAREEVMLLIAFGTVLTALKGSAAPEVEQTYARARTLCRDLDDPAYLFPVLRGLQSFYLVRGPLRTASSLVQQLQQIAEQTGDALQRVEADRRLGWCLFCMGDLDAGRGYLERAMQRYDRAQSLQHIVTYGSDPGIHGLVNLAWVECFAGRAQRAVQYSNKALALARELSYGLGMAYALAVSAAMHQSLGDDRACGALAQETILLAEKHGFPYWTAWATNLLGWATAAQGDLDTGIEMLERGMQTYRATGAELLCPYMLGLLAEMEMRAGRYDEALMHCDEALGSSERTDAHFFDAEIHRVEGECLFVRDHDVVGAEIAFASAIAVARRQQADALALRAAVSLAVLRDAQGLRATACELLTEECGRFSAESDTTAPELVKARRLLKEWGRG